MIAGDINRDAVNRNRLAAFFMPRQQKGGDTVAKKMTLHELQAEQEKAERELKIAKQNLRILKSDEKKLTRKERTHRLCNHGGLLEKYLPPDKFTDEQMEEILTTLFRWNDVIVLINDVAKRSKSSEEPDTG